MKPEGLNHDDAAPDVRRVLDAYPRLAASPKFDARVLQAVLSRPSLPDRLDALFARPVLKLLGSAALGLLFSGVITALLLWPLHANGAASGSSSESTSVSLVAETVTPRDWNRYYALGHWRSEYFEAEELPEPSAQDDGRESSWDAAPSPHLSSLPFGLLS